MYHFTEPIIDIHEYVLNCLLFQAAEKKPAFVEKKVGGAKNGGTRKVATNKPKFDYPTYSK